MSTLRPEVLAFMRAAQGLFSTEAQETSLPLSDDETEKIVDCMAKLEQVLLDGDLTRVDATETLLSPILLRSPLNPEELGMIRLYMQTVDEKLFNTATASVPRS